MTILMTVLLNICKDVSIVAIFAKLCMYFNNIWIILFAVLFVGGYSVKINEKEKKGEEENG